MKRFLWNIRRDLRPRPIHLPRIKINGGEIKRFFSRYLMRTVFFVVFCGGMIAGALYSKSVDKGVVKQLDLLFTTNLSVRMELSAFEIFLSCLASYLIFALAAFLLGLSVWGFCAMPVLSGFKGFSVGLSSALIFLMYKTAGIGFYILVILPGAVIFLLGFINFSCYAMRLSVRYLRFTVKREDVELRVQLKLYLVRSLTFLMFCVGAAMTDMLLWILFAHLFEF